MKRLLLIFALLAGPALAVQPDEVLDDPALEERARDISSGLRCLVCRNESIDDSNAELARDLRLLVRERLLEGDSNEEVVDYIVDRYGEYVLLNPVAGGANWILWLAGPGMLILGVSLAAVYIRRRGQAEEPHVAALSEEETARLRRIMDE
ncbi:cytochrome c-type biogenesis protein [Roseovarius aestuariivivens]|uniref:cytochrome c-type biogenesis protein n=1 Tax=Roseovarius aestuariivivens TaxID=1888910 RepID=UPI0010801E41|nr:cytochrome c-type biogenesis protein [Roseovarius aestuariivivens]